MSDDPKFTLLTTGFSPPEIAIKSGAMRVIASGSVIAFKNNPIEFKIGGTYTIVIVFEEEDAAADGRMKTEAVDSQTFQITCFNFKSKLLITGHSEPIYVATYSGQPIYLQFRTLGLTGGDITLFYTFYMSEVASE